MKYNEHADRSKSTIRGRTAQSEPSEVVRHGPGGDAMESGYNVRLYSVYSTYWRRSTGTRRVSGDFDLSERVRSIYLSFQVQLPELLHQRKFEVSQVRLKSNVEQPVHGLDGAELVLFSLPFPANQIVAALVLDFQTPDLNADSTGLRRILKACTDSDLLVND